ncbi:MAG: 50S ribosomal protein L21 [Alphaproteobacteria bacterium]|nr:50S ribosomal protein L21 [Alphaproteobacteria bacterium]
MFAVIVTGGKQYRVGQGDRLTVERLPGEVGTMIALDKVLMIGEAGKAPTIGTPTVAKAAVFAEILAQDQGDKVIVFKKRRRKNYRRRVGHRQDQTRLRIVGVSATGEKPAFTPSVKKAAAPESAPAKKAAAKSAGQGKGKPKTKSKATSKAKAKE